MNTDNGHLMRALYGEPLPQGYSHVPKNLEDEAEEVLERAEAANEPAVVDMTKKTPLVQWARHDRKANKRMRTKLAKAGRRANRRKS